GEEFGAGRLPRLLLRCQVQHPEAGPGHAAPAFRLGSLPYRLFGSFSPNGLRRLLRHSFRSGRCAGHGRQDSVPLARPFFLARRRSRAGGQGEAWAAHCQAQGLGLFGKRRRGLCCWSLSFLQGASSINAALCTGIGDDGLAHVDELLNLLVEQFGNNGRTQVFLLAIACYQDKLSGPYLFDSSPGLLLYCASKSIHSEGSEFPYCGCIRWALRHIQQRGAFDERLV
ncbi:unnamed protein product, partial [Polarella glacialis]